MKKEILLEDVFNEEKKKGVKELIDKHKQKTLEEVAERLKGKELFKESNDRARKVLSEIKSLPKQERSYSKEEVLSILQKYRFDFSLYRNIQVLPLEFSKWFEQFKKK